MKIILTIIKWVIRIFYLFLLISFDFIPDMYLILIADIIFNSLALLRFNEKEYFKVITGFGGKEIKYFGTTENKSNKVFGIIFLLISFLLKGFMLLAVVNNLDKLISLF